MENDKKIEETTFLVVGGGIAGVSCAENISFLCPGQKIILLTETSLIKAVTNLVPLGKMIHKFDVTEKSAEEGINKKVSVIVDTLVSIQSEMKQIQTFSGRTIRYKYLCLCSGATPKLIDSNNSNIIGIRDTESVIDFQKRIKSSRKLIIVGNGGIASELAYEVKNIEIDWVVKDNHIASTFVDPGAAQFFQKSLLNKDANQTEKVVVKRMRYSAEGRGAALGPDWHRKIDISGNLTNLPNSVRIHYQTEIQNIESTCNENDEYPLKVTLTNGEVLFSDFVVSATGVDPQLKYSTDLDFELGSDGGIKVDDMMRTNIADVFAAGDVCYAGWVHEDNWFQMRLWTQARQMGCMAGRSMAAVFTNEPIYQDFCFQLFGHVTQLFGYQVVLLGRYNGQDLGKDYEILLRVTNDKEYVKFVLKDGRLRGAILIGDTGLEETCENLILNQLDLTPYGDDLLDPNIDIEDYFD